jgi:hypothetical protein
VDSVIQAAKSYGITVFANPMFVGEGGRHYENSILASSDATITAYGAWLGNRYKSYPNIVWLLGGDTDFSVTGLPQKMGDLAAGIASADTNHLMLMEPIRNQSSAQIWNQATALTLNWVYPDYSHAQSLCASNYASYHMTIPSLMGEDWYEGEHSMTPLQLREEAYWEVLSGCTLGRIFGNNAIWTMGGPKDSMGQTWQSQLGSGGSLTEANLGALFRSREFWKMVPDSNNQTLTAGFGSGTTISVAARTSDGQTIIAYIPNGNATTITIDMSKIASATSTAKCWWFKPSNGSSTLIGTFANSGTEPFTPPDPNDWVLVIDDASASLAAPGSAQMQAGPLTPVSPPSPASSAGVSPLPVPMRWLDCTMVTGLAFVLVMLTAGLRSRKRRFSHRGSHLRSGAVKKWDANSAAPLCERR